MKPSQKWSPLTAALKSKETTENLTKTYDNQKAEVNQNKIKRTEELGQVRKKTKEDK